MPSVPFIRHTSRRSPSTSPYHRHRFPAEIIQSLELKPVGLPILNLGMDIQTPTGKLMLTVLVGFAQFERELMLERQRKRVAKAKTAGKYNGRKPLAFDLRQEVVRLAAGGLAKVTIARYQASTRACRQKCRICQSLSLGVIQLTKDRCWRRSARHSHCPRIFEQRNNLWDAATPARECRRSIHLWR
jgi:hypothetical protein